MNKTKNEIAFIKEMIEKYDLKIRRFQRERIGLECALTLTPGQQAGC